MKKFTATSLLALTLLLGVSSSAFAATYPDNEPNDTAATANPFYVAHGNQINGILGNTYNGKQDGQDYYTFTTSSVPQKVRFQIAYSKAGGQYYKLRLNAANATTQTKDYFDVNLAANTTYTFRVEAYVINFDETDRTYSVYTYVLPN